MRILAIADAESRALEHFDPTRWGQIDLVVSCGDLKAGYLDYVATMLNVPCLYVRGNHDAEYRHIAGWENLDGRIVTIGGLRFAGLEGSRWYGGQGVEVGDRGMDWRARLLGWRIALAGGVDVLLTHAPPILDDGPTDHVHRGFAAFNRLIDRYCPSLHLHGHIHLDYGRGPRERHLGTTRVVDCYGAYVIDFERPLTPSRRPRTLLPVWRNGPCVKERERGNWRHVQSDLFPS
jgi:predicted phosphodiesterase